MYNAGLALSRHFREEFSRHGDGRSPVDQNLYAQLAQRSNCGIDFMKCINISQSIRSMLFL